MNVHTEVPYVTRRARSGMVCSVDHLASGAGVQVLRAGGSAADAAIAASAVLAVTTQHMCGMGGDLWALVHFADGEAPAALNASGRAGSGADAAQLRADGHTEMPFHGDVRSVPVPGCVDGWLTLHQRFGRLPLADVLAPAIDLATHGFPIAPQCRAYTGLIEGLPNTDDYFPNGRPSTGDLIRRPGVARALQAVVAEGREGHYLGEFGDALLTLGAGEYVEDDLRTPQADWVTPISVEAWGHRIWTVPPNSQGYLSLASSWLADRLDLPTDVDDPAWAHLLIECAKQAGFDRPGVLHERADGASLVSSERLAPRLDAIDPARATAVGAGVHDGDTIYLCAVDADRMGVSLIQSNAAGWGAHLFLPGTGISLHNRGIGFSLEPGHPAEYAPGRRPPHTLAPALVQTADQALRAVLGTMGGDSQPQVVLQMLARLLHAGQPPAEVIAAGRWRLAGSSTSGFHTWSDPRGLVVEVEGHAPGWDTGLVERGHALSRVEAHSSAFGHAHLIDVGADVLAGGADPRALTGGVAGY